MLIPPEVVAQVLICRGGLKEEGGGDLDEGREVEGDRRDEDVAGRYRVGCTDEHSPWSREGEVECGLDIGRLSSVL